MEAQAPARKALAIDDYPKWPSIDGEKLSGDGRWVAYVLRQMNTIPAESKPVLHLLQLETGAEVTVDDATAPAFSQDSKWVAYQVDPGAAARARAARRGSGAGGSGGAGGSAASGQGQEGGRGGAAIPPRRVELRNLETGAVRSWENVGNVTFSPASTNLVLQRRAADAPDAPAGRGGGAPGAKRGGADGAALASGPRGSTILLDLRTGAINCRQRRRPRLQPHGRAHGLHRGLAREGRQRPPHLRRAKRPHHALRQRRPTVLRPRLERRRERRGRAQGQGRREDAREGNVPAFRDVPPKERRSAPRPCLDRQKRRASRRGGRSDRAPLAWSEDNARVFFGMKEQVPAPDTTRRSTDETPDVDVWNTADERVQSRQMIQANQDRNFAFRQAFIVASAWFVKLADQTMKD
jgi:hypothetical protein